MRLVLTVRDFDAALTLYRDALGLEVEAVWSSEGGRVVLLSAGRATLELVDEAHAAEIDNIQVADSSAKAIELEAAGAERIAGPVTTPWNDRNVRLQTSDGTQLTLFTTLE